MENLQGIIVGAATFLIIGICHPIVIKAEYRFTKKCWVWFLAIGLFFAVLSLFVESLVFSTISAVTGFSFLWGILELFQQEKRVLRGWFPENPAHADYYAARRRETGIQA